MKERCFSLEELDEIISIANSYNNPNKNIYFVAGLIFGISNNTGLILPFGNSETGYYHIFERHSLLSRKLYKNDNPTKFSLKYAPVNYLEIADKIFNKNNLDIKNNHYPDLFDLYNGKYILKDNINTYTLITYKNTKVIHTLFLNNNKKPFNKKKIIDLRQGWVKSSRSYSSCINTFEMPYFDENDVEKLIIIKRHLELENISKWYIQLNSQEGTPFVTILIKEEDELTSKSSLPFEMTNLDFGDISWAERIIKQIINGRYLLE